ncbi:MAG: hypothetical protein ABI905_11340 [Betaproteobacteria bacterium]
MKRRLLLSTLLTSILATCAGNALAIGHLASIDLYDRTEGRNLPVYWHHGKAYVVGAPGNEYQITVRNTNGHDMLAVVSVDGVNVVSGETAATQQGGYVIDGWQQMDIAGWRKSMSRTAAFYFTSLGDSYAARTGRPGNVGVIGAALYRRKPDPVAYAPPPTISEAQPYDYPRRERADAPAAAAAPRTMEKSLGDSRSENEYRGQSGSMAQPKDKLGTGHGRSENSPARYTSFERATSQPEEMVSIYYDSYANLVAMGVIPSPPRNYPRREPQAFPGPFVPDPR